MRQDLTFFLIHTRDTVFLIANFWLWRLPVFSFIIQGLGSGFERHYLEIPSPEIIEKRDLIFQVLILNFKEHASRLFESPYFNLHIHWSILILAIIAELSGLDILFLFQQGRGPIFGLLSLSVNLLGTIGNVGTDHCHCWLICWSIVFHFIIPYTFEEKNEVGGWRSSFWNIIFIFSFLFYLLHHALWKLDVYRYHWWSLYCMAVVWFCYCTCIRMLDWSKPWQQNAYQSCFC